MLRLISVLALIDSVISECENGCSGHGRCTLFDMCICYRNWQAIDCSERVCPFGIAFVDAPKGDLDGSGSLSGPEELIAVNNYVYPYGTQEQFPRMADSRNRPLTNSAHAYSECSGAGNCNRKTGICDCHEGFEGTGCQRMSCDGDDDSCSGHGVCKSAHRTAINDNGNSYQLWDASTTTTCVCDAPYYGGDCAMKHCPYGIDPLYFDDIQTIRLPVYYFAVLTTSSVLDFSDGTGGPAHFTIVMTDMFGQQLQTGPIPVMASCDIIVAAIESLPMGAFPSGQTQCQRSYLFEEDPLDNGMGQWNFQYISRYRAYITGLRTDSMTVTPSFWAANYQQSYAVNKSSDVPLSGNIYRIQFLGNPGDWPEPSISRNSRGDWRPSLQTSTGKLMTAVWTDGQQGEQTDFIADHCAGVSVNVGITNGYTFLTGFYDDISAKLKKCLGGADYDEDNNIGAENWDRGTIYNPHLVRLIRSTTDYRDGGFYVVLYFDTTATNLDWIGLRNGNVVAAGAGTYKILHSFKPLDSRMSADPFDVYTTRGVLQVVGAPGQAEAFFDFASKIIYTTNTTYDLHNTSSTAYDGDISCDRYTLYSEQTACLQKNDKFFVLDPVHTYLNPAYLNMYTALMIERAMVDDIVLTDYNNATSFPKLRHDLSFMKKNVIHTDLSTNWAQHVGGAAHFFVYKFSPNSTSNYNYVSECSNRGNCNTFEGMCECYSGYMGKACDEEMGLTV